mmetsp:Transcript_31648/g.38755  ORF Transcript_31648/g.38755 Transcript_31648/m.38755 type:complete len:295 (+) Transcript_31648:433-1317(+)
MNEIMVASSSPNNSSICLEIYPFNKLFFSSCAKLTKSTTGGVASSVSFVNLSATSAAASAALFASRIAESDDAVPVAVSNRCFRAFRSRLASEGTNFRFLLPPSFSSCGRGGGGGGGGGVPSPPPPPALAASFAFVIQAGRLLTPRFPLSFTAPVPPSSDGSGGGGGGGGTPAVPSPPPPAFRSARRLFTSVTVSQIFRSTTSTRFFLMPTSRSSKLFLNFATASKTSGALSGSASSSYAPPPAAAATLLTSSFFTSVPFFLLDDCSSRAASSSFVNTSRIFFTTVFVSSRSVS